MRVTPPSRTAQAWIGLWTVLLAIQAGSEAQARSSAFKPVTAAPAVPFSQPGPFRPWQDQQPAAGDVTGSVKEPAPAVSTAAPSLAIPDLGIAAPEVPAALVSPARDGAFAAALHEELARFTADDHQNTLGPEQARRREERQAIAAFYAARAEAPLWIEGTHFSAVARSAMSRLDRAAEDGLTLRRDPVPVLRDPSAVDLAQAELALSEAVVAYARQAGGSRVDPLQINRLITAKRTLAPVPDILSAVSAASDPGAVLQGYNPPQPGYTALRAMLATVRQAAPQARAGIPSGPTLKLGMRDARVPLVRSRFGLGAPAAEPAADDLVYDTKVAAAVADFQRSNGLPVSGSLTPRTIAALSGGEPLRLENELVANMERWRWVPRDLGSDHIMVNVPDFTLDVTQDGAVTHHARVVVGKPDHQTPIFSDAMRFIIVNPYWNVPLSIIKKEMMPKLAADPNYFADHGYEVVDRDGQTFVRQPPGDDNALGRIKFMFPNQHSVYLHDTNARALFGKDKRAFSHGCVRVDQPFKLAAVLLNKAGGWSEARIRKMVGGVERTVNLPQPMPIHIVYFTAFVDRAGGLQLRDDVYGYSEKVKLALGLRD